MDGGRSHLRAEDVALVDDDLKLLLLLHALGLGLVDDLVELLHLRLEERLLVRHVLLLLQERLQPLPQILLLLLHLHVLKVLAHERRVLRLDLLLELLDLARHHLQPWEIRGDQGRSEEIRGDQGRDVMMPSIKSGRVGRSGEIR